MKKERRNTDHLRTQLLTAYGRVMKRAAERRQRGESGFGESAQARGLAHYVTTIFAPITGRWSDAPVELEGKDFLKAYVRGILFSSEKAALLTRRLIAFNRSRLTNPAPMLVVHEAVGRAGHG